MEPVFRTLEIAKAPIAVSIGAAIAPTPVEAKNLDEAELAERARRRADRK